VLREEWWIGTHRVVDIVLDRFQTLDAITPTTVRDPGLPSCSMHRGSSPIPRTNDPR
jgi:hypothetical protein